MDTEHMCSKTVLTCPLSHKERTKNAAKLYVVMSFKTDDVIK